MCFPHILWEHWVVMGLLSLVFTVICLFRKNSSLYGAVVLGITVFVGLFIVEALALSRHVEDPPLAYGSGLDLTKEYDRLVHGGLTRWAEMLFNILAFVPFGFFLFETLGSLAGIGNRRRIGVVSLIAFMLSLGIEFLQHVLQVGLFEVTDLIMNEIGGFVGAWTAIWGRTLKSWFRAKKKTNGCFIGVD